MDEPAASGAGVESGVSGAQALAPPQELFRELAELGNLLFCLLVGPAATAGRWSALYLVYAHLDRLCHEVGLAGACLARGFAGAAGAIDQPAIENANACLTRLDTQFHALADLLVRMQSRAGLGHASAGLKRIGDYHFAPSSPWYAASRQYCSGRVSGDGRVMRRTSLLLDPLPGPGQAAAPARVFLQRQVFELGSPQSRALLARMARHVQRRLYQVYAALGERFAANCPAVKDMLHPSAP